MFENLKLYHKGLLLVSTPLAFELLFIGLLAVALNQSDRAIQAEAHARAVSDQLGLMQRHHFESVSALGTYAVSHNGSFLSAFEVGVELIKSDLANLKRLTAENKQEAEEFARVDKIVQVEIVRAAEIKSMLANRQSVELIAAFKSLKRVMSALGVHLDAIGEQEKRSLQIGPVVRSQMRQQIWQLLGAGLLLNVILAVSLARYFGVTTVKRLSVLMDNTGKLGRGEVLQGSVGGSDEIGQLGERFEMMATDLRNAQRIRREFVAMVTHELRTPLTSVAGYMEVLGDGRYGALSDRGRQRLGVVNRNIDRILGLIGDLIDIEKIEAGKFELALAETSLRPIIDRSIESVRVLAEKQQLQMGAAGVSTAEVICDENRIQQVIVNLLSNAIKFSPPGAAISVEAEAYPEKKGMLEVRVIDHGRGIPVEQIDAVFDRFAQVEVADAVKKGGSGLGLAICKALVQQHGGEIGVRSQVNKGSTFWFTLRLVEGANEMETQPQS